jgi:hypothetical protein
MKKTLFLVTSFVFALSLVLFPSFTPSEAKAATSSNVTQHVQLKTLYVDISYNPSTQKLVKSTEQNETTTVTVVDKQTGEEIDEFGEKDSQSKVQSKLSLAGAIQPLSGFYDTASIYHTKTLGSIKARLYTVMKVYHSGSFTQINSIKDHYWQEGSSGPWRLESEHSSAISASSGFPTTSVRTSGTAVVTVTTQHSGEFSASALEVLGFSVSSGGEYNARKSISLGYTYSVQ